MSFDLGNQLLTSNFSFLTAMMHPRGDNQNVTEELGKRMSFDLGNQLLTSNFSFLTISDILGAIIRTSRKNLEKE